MSAAAMSEPAAPCRSCGERDWRENVGWSPERPCPACGNPNETLEQRREREPWFEREPVYHSWVTDCLPDDHPMAWVSQFCESCQKMVHAFNNECMDNWFETKWGVYCLTCFAAAEGDPVPSGGLG